MSVLILGLFLLAQGPATGAEDGLPPAGAGDVETVALVRGWDRLIRERTAGLDETLLGWVPHAEAGYPEVRAALAPHAPAVLVAYHDTGETLTALVQRSDSDLPVSVPLGDREVLLSRLRLFARSGDTADLARVRAMAWDPLARHLDGVTTILVVPDGPLRRFPLRAFAAPEVRGDLRILTTERDLLDPPPAPIGEPPRLVAVGDLLYDSLAHQGTPFPAHFCPASRERFTTRTAAIDEMEALRIAWGAYVPDGERRMLTGTIATEAAVREAVPGTRYVHFSSRAYLLDDLCPDGEFVPGGIAGVALTGANAATGAESAAADGLLTAGEMARLDLGGVESVVIADLTRAADSETAGHGWSILTRSLRLAGARTVVLRVPGASDADAGAWLKLYYRELLSDRTSAREAAAEATRIRFQELGAGAGDPPLRWMPFLVIGG